ncbi:hypothetical protein EYF80_049136 [Liparis tanakae]|uniref:Uncharacterized protein n=1 Tax=Liparis tanakae TaxID=230148 RepID=A0A4Z2FIC5_9TELE|nr:hypothetical protein EYF80_049136 [Liparis tanakae]
MEPCFDGGCRGNVPVSKVYTERFCPLVIIIPPPPSPPPPSPRRRLRHTEPRPGRTRAGGGGGDNTWNQSAVDPGKRTQGSFHQCLLPEATND